MKYRHSFHAGNFADVHKHVTLLQLLTALKKKGKGFLYLDTHAGRGSYDLSSPSAAAAARRRPPSPTPPERPTGPGFGQVTAALAEGLRRFPTGVFAAWYPIKDERRTALWQADCARTLRAPALVCELWLYPRDSQVGLNGSGLLIANPPHLTLERLQAWLPELGSAPAVGPRRGASARRPSQTPRWAARRVRTGTSATR